ncbi:cAMP-dependent protein kinase type II regulatory subunit [Parasteatoda tepidariorum]|uniref:cAMP-dependent protein kinase type II regulatory subunit n=1 Tax=Parasteatoda tepidariorum TaxID=114398 RepID=UPI00077FAD65|nr:cAMP-dependent protein kinase type II regulatory subunit [Parasteatoda tepidariorum]
MADDKNEIHVPEELENMLLHFTTSVLEEQPDDIIDYAASYFSRLKRERSDQGISKMLGRRGRRRTAVIGEVVNPEECDSEVKIYPKSKEQKERIKNLIEDVFLFKHLTKENLDAIIDAMIPSEVKSGQIIIKQNDDADFFYVIDKGEFDAIIEEEGRQEVVMKYKDSGSFGELALLHNQPRAATIKAVTDGMLWAVSRATFTKLVVKTAYEKRKRYMELLDKVPELQPLIDYEKMQVCDALISVYLRKGEVLFKEGDRGDGMYFVEKGAITINKEVKGGEAQLALLKPGDYFGELALVRNKPRAGTARALEDSELAFLDVGAFERLLGPCMDIINQRADSYEKIDK